MTQIELAECLFGPGMKVMRAEWLLHARLVILAKNLLLPITNANKGSSRLKCTFVKNGYHLTAQTT